MARYYFHVKKGQQLIPDEEGDELPDDERARAAAIEAARELIAEAIKAGRDPDIDALVVEDEHGHTAAFLPLTEALPRRAVRPRQAGHDGVRKNRSRVLGR